MYRYDYLHFTLDSRSGRVLLVDLPATANTARVSGLFLVNIKGRMSPAIPREEHRHPNRSSFIPVITAIMSPEDPVDTDNALFKPESLFADMVHPSQLLTSFFPLVTSTLHFKNKQ
jgi:hypothetical protein